MSKLLPYAALAAALTFTAPALAQQPMPATGAAGATGGQSMSAPSTGAGTAPTTSASQATTAESAGSNANVTAGMTVKDNTGAAIGQVTDVKADASGAKLATIKMGSQTFAVETTKLGVSNGAATINATQAELQSMLKK